MVVHGCLEEGKVGGKKGYNLRSSIVLLRRQRAESKSCIRETTRMVDETPAGDSEGGSLTPGENVHPFRRLTDFHHCGSINMPS